MILRDLRLAIREMLVDKNFGRATCTAIRRVVETRKEQLGLGRRGAPAPAAGIDMSAAETLRGNDAAAMRRGGPTSKKARSAANPNPGQSPRQRKGQPMLPLWLRENANRFQERRRCDRSIPIVVAHRQCRIETPENGQ